jgi:hypothetical protein
VTTTRRRRAAKAPSLRIEGFLQREPGDLVPISQPTEAYLSYD